MDQGWIKFHRRVMDNVFLMQDNTAYVIFTKLLLLVDTRTGTYTTGRFQLSEHTNIKPNTLYKALLRLEDNRLVTLKSNNRFTNIHICNWSKYQTASNTSSNTTVTTGEQQSNNKVTLNKNKELRIKNKEIITSQPNKSSDRSGLNKDVQEVFNHYIKSFNANPNVVKLSDKRRAKIQVRLGDAGKDMLLKAITNISNSPFHRGDNSRGWRANIDFIINSYEKVEEWANKEEDIAQEYNFTKAAPISQEELQEAFRNAKF